MINIEGNTCPICLISDLNWNLHINKSDVHMFKCGHGTCKSCFIKLNNSSSQFKCPLCREEGQKYKSLIPDINDTPSYEIKECKTFAEWFDTYEIFITSGAFRNGLKHTNFGTQLIRLIKQSKQNKQSKPNPKNPNPKNPKPSTQKDNLSLQIYF